MSDFRVEDHGSVVLLVPLTEAAREWCAEHVAPDVPWHAGGCAVSPHEIVRVMRTVREDGLSCEVVG